MRSFLLAFIFAALFALPAHAQTRFLVGADGGDSFNNYFLGIRASLEAPLGKHFEADESVSFFPIENKPSYGKGVSYSLEPGATVWANTTSGFEGSFHHTGYTVTTVKKTEDFVFAGYVYKHTMVGFPTRFHFDYVREVNDGISSNGTEMNHLQGGAFSFDSRIGCFRFACVRDQTTLLAGRVLDQGNPVCDGTYTGKITCPRNSNLSGGFEMTFMFEIPRPKNEWSLF